MQYIVIYVNIYIQGGGDWLKKMFSLRLPTELREKLEKVAKEEDRSIANVIIKILKEYFK